MRFLLSNLVAVTLLSAAARCEDDAFGDNTIVVNSNDGFFNGNLAQPIIKVDVDDDDYQGRWYGRRNPYWYRYRRYWPRAVDNGGKRENVVERTAQQQQQATGNAGGFSCDKSPQDVKASEGLQTPSTPSFPLTPESINVPQAPQIPQAPQAPETPQTPQAPQAPQIPQIPQAPQAPETPQVPTCPLQEQNLQQQTDACDSKKPEKLAKSPIQIQGPIQERLIQSPIQIQAPAQEGQILVPIQVQVPTEESQAQAPRQVQIPVQELQIQAPIHAQFPMQERQIQTPSQAKFPMQEQGIQSPSQQQQQHQSGYGYGGQWSDKSLNIPQAERQVNQPLTPFQQQSPFMGQGRPYGQYGMAMGSRGQSTAQGPAQLADLDDMDDMDEVEQWWRPPYYPRRYPYYRPYPWWRRRRF